MKRAQASIAGLNVDIWCGGEGRDLLFLHPGSGLADHAGFLSRLAENFRVTAPAHPGFDGSENSPEYTRAGDLAYFYLDLIESLELDRPILVGSSLGAWLAAEIAVRCTLCCSKLVLIGPLGAKFASPQDREITDLFSYPIYEQDRFLFSDGRLANRTYADTEESERLRMARNFELFARLAWSPTLYNPKLRHRLARLKMPALVLRGQNDRVVSEAYCRNFARALPCASFEQVEEAGHYAHIEQPDRVGDRIRTFAEVGQDADAPPRAYMGVAE